MFQATARVPLGTVEAVMATCSGERDEKTSCAWRTIGATNIRRTECPWHDKHLRKNTIYPERLLRRRFGVPRRFLWRIHEDFVRKKPYYRGRRPRKCNRVGRRSTIKTIMYLRIFRTELYKTRWIIGRAWSRKRILFIYKV